MLTLVVERSTRRPGWALFRDVACVLEMCADVEPSRAPGWLAELKAALDGANVSLADIDRFAVGLGPGSFSGTRAAVAALQGMALPGGRPLLGVNSAAALALRLLTARAAEGDTTPVAVVGDARRDRIWCAVFGAPPLMAWTRQGMRPLSHDAHDFALTTWADLPSCLPSDALIVSPDWDRIGARLTALFPAARLAAGDDTPTAADVGHLAISDPSATRSEPMPIYLHPAVVERKA